MELLVDKVSYLWNADSCYKFDVSLYDNGDKLISYEFNLDVSKFNSSEDVMNSLYSLALAKWNKFRLESSIISDVRKLRVINGTVVKKGY
jgi:hypothetical protein